MEEAEAIARLKQGDVGGLEALVHGHQVQAVRTAYLITRDRALAEDIVQAAFVRAHERIEQFDTGRSLVPAECGQRRHQGSEPSRALGFNGSKRWSATRPG